jgi:hypothetical protein
MKLKLLSSIFLLSMGSIAHAVPEPEPMDPMWSNGQSEASIGVSKNRHDSHGKVGPVNVKVECQDKSCKTAVFHLGYGISQWISTPLQCAWTPCGVDNLEWHAESRLVSIATRNNDMFLIKAVWEQKSLRDVQDRTNLEQKGPLIPLGSGFFSVDDASQTVWRKPPFTGYSWNEAFQVSPSGLLLANREKTCSKYHAWFMNEKNALEERALGIRKTPKPTPSSVPSEERVFLEMSEHCQHPISGLAESQARKAPDTKKKFRFLDSDNFWNPN